MIHHVEQDLFQDRAQATGADATFERHFRDRVDRALGELELDAVQFEQFAELSDQRVLRLDQNAHQRFGVQGGHRGDHRKPPDELRDQPEPVQVFGAYLFEGVDRGGLADRCVIVEAQWTLADPCVDDLLKAREGAAHDEQDVCRVDLDEFLVWMLAPTLRRDRGRRPFENLQ